MYSSAEDTIRKGEKANGTTQLNSDNWNMVGFCLKLHLDLKMPGSLTIVIYFNPKHFEEIHVPHLN